ncbi:MAG TPA: FAD-dependent oxidoreductase, partial [Bdellovibrionales bacterium]|nr:FAD-dependent oxidoreductase [Bdellovibrionales bacterium]
MQKINRRQMIQLLGAGAASVYLGGCTTNAKRSPSGGPAWIDRLGPVDRTLGDVAPLDFTGDKPSLAHQILWNKAAFITKQGGLPSTVEDAEVVIVGGGMSGLLAAYNLRDLRPVVLDQAERLGGNSRAESWRGLDYSLATAYFTIPDAGSEIDVFFKELGIDKVMRAREVNDPVFIDGVRYDDIWNKGTNAKSRPQFRKLKKLFLDTLAGTNGARYPELPYDNDDDRRYTEKLDRVSFKDYIEAHLKARLHPHVEAVVEYYFWSACASSSTEISAAAGLNFFAADFGAIAVTPGGNAAIAERILLELSKTMPAERFRVSSLVFDVRYEKDRVLVSYWNGERIKTLRARAVVMC